MRICLALFFLLLLSYMPLYAGEAGDGRRIFEVRCVGCHQLPEPGMLKPDQWRMVLQTMQKKYLILFLSFTITAISISLSISPSPLALEPKR